MESQVSSYLLKLRRANPFLATISLLADYRFTDQVDFFATDSQSVFINSDYFASLEDNEKTGLLLHLTLHAALLHPLRTGARSPDIWNMAADIVVNNIILDAGNFKPPPKTAVEPKYQDLSVEQVYEALISLHKKHPALQQAALNMPSSPDCESTTGKSSSTKQQPNDFQLQQVLKNLYPHHADLMPPAVDSNSRELGKNKAKSSTPTSNQSDHKKSANDKSSSQAAQKRHMDKIKQQWQGALRKAEVAVRMSGKGRGEVPAGLLLEIDKMMNPEFDWRLLLWQFVVRTPDDFQGYDRRFIHQGLYLDQLESSRLNVVVAVDTSGSIDKRELTQFMSELLAISNTYEFIQVLVYYVDADIYGPYDLVDGFDEAPPQGGGGTDFAVFFKHLDNNKHINPIDLIVYFTDGDGFFPANPPEAETLWVVTAGGVVDEEFPFGVVARLTNQS